MSQLRE